MNISDLEKIDSEKMFKVYDKWPEIARESFEGKFKKIDVKDVDHIVVPKGEHHSIGIAEKGIQDLSVMLRCSLADSNIPRIYWDYVIEHCALAEFI